jgi:hypothetical protein
MGNNVVITVITGHFLTQAMCQRTIYSPTIERIFAIIALVKFTQDPLSTPNLASCSFWVYPKVLVPLSVVPIDRALRRFNGTIIAIVYDTPSHSAEDRFDNVEKLRPCGQWCSFHHRISFSERLLIFPFDMHR